MTPDPYFPPFALRDYAVLADGERGALIGPRGDVVWMCAPSWHSDAVFSSLIGGAGGYAITPVERFVWGGYYEDGTLIRRSRWVTASGIVECREALAFPGEPGRAVLLRRVVATDGPARLRVVLEPAAGFGARSARGTRRDEHGVWTARAGRLHFRWTGAGTARPEGGGRLVAELRLAPGERHDLVLEVADGEPGGPVDADRAWAATEAAWEREVPALAGTVAPEAARRSYAVLRGLTTPGGGTVAAATTSLPERADRSRDYDYRYVWVRDQCYIGQSVAAAGSFPLLEDAVRFVAARLHEDGPGLRPAYTPAGGPVPDQRRLDLPGYPGGHDTVGNRVNRQFQLDVFGEALLLFAAAARAGRLDDDALRATDIAARAIADRWREPDAGIWELEPREWTHSRLICAAGLRAVADATGRDAGPRRELADAIVAGTAARALHPDGRWLRSPGDPRPDAALLLAPIRGAVPPDDPRAVATLRAYRDELTRDHFAYRFRHGDGPLEEAEGAFLLCGFVMALAEHQRGRHVEAYRWFERNRAACGPPGLFAEEYDITQGQLRGNLPQTFVHGLLLECAARLADEDPHPGEGRRS
jgi:hypothetical protein